MIGRYEDYERIVIGEHVEVLFLAGGAGATKKQAWR